jgi:molybdopterin synthase sulfur carrier subunit
MGRTDSGSRKAAAPVGGRRSAKRQRAQDRRRDRRVTGGPRGVSIQVVFFSFAAERMNARQVTVEVPEGSTVADVFRQFQDRLGPGLSFAFAVNDEWATPEDVLKPGDVLAVIPPVAGG